MAGRGERFRRVSRNEALRGYGASHFARGEVAPGPAGLDRGDFLGRLWALFGRPDRLDYGFTYPLKDEVTGIWFHVGWGGSGPHYISGASVQTLRAVARGVEELLAATPPADCAWVADVEIDHGGGKERYGVRGGKPFHEPVKQRGTNPRSVKTYADCLAVARKTAGEWPLAEGWFAAMRKVVPDPPTPFDLDGRTFWSCIGLGPGKDEAAVFLFDDRDASDPNRELDEIPPERIPWAADEPLGPLARLWLASYDRWRREEKKTGRRGKRPAVRPGKAGRPR